MGFKVARNIVFLILFMVGLFQGIPGTKVEWACKANAVSKTQDQAIEWCKSNLGQSIDVDGYPYYQCVDFAQAYYIFLGVSPSSGSGKEYSTNTLPAGWTRVAGGIPQKGDILVYGASALNEHGHVAIYESDYSTYHQNFGNNGKVTNETYKYNELKNPYWGYIRPDWKSPIGTPIDMGSVFDVTISDANGKSMYLDSDNSIKMGNFTYSNRSKYMWKFEAVGGNAYKISNWSNGQVIDCAGAGSDNGTKFQTYSWNDTNAQKFYIYDMGNGFYAIEPACARGSALDKGGTNGSIHLWEFEKNNYNQLFTFSASGTKADIGSNFNAKITNGTKALYENTSGDVVLQQFSESDKRFIWNFTKNSDGSYAIKNLNDDKGLDCNNWGKENSTNISAVSYYGSSAQKWNIYDVGSGTYVLEPQCAPGRVADIGGTNYSIHLWEYSNNNANQRFLLVSDESTEQQIEGPDAITVSSPSYSAQLDYTIGGSKEDIVYESLDSSIIKVEDGSDWLTAVSPGTAVLRVKSKSNSKKYKDVICTVGALELMDYGTINSSEARVLKFDAYTNNAEGDCYLSVKTSVSNCEGKELKIKSDYPVGNKGRNWIYCIVDKKDFNNESGDYTTTATLYDGNGNVVDEYSTTYNFSNYKNPYYVNVNLNDEFDVYENANAQSIQPITRFYSAINENKNNNHAGEIELISDNTFKGTKAGKLYCAYLNYSTAERLMVIIDISSTNDSNDDSGNNPSETSDDDPNDSPSDNPDNNPTQDNSDVEITGIKLQAEVKDGKIKFNWNVPDKAATFGIVYALYEQELDVAEANNGYEVSGLKASGNTMTYDCPTDIYENQQDGVWFRVVMKNGDEVKHSNAVKITNWSGANPNGDPGEGDDNNTDPKSEYGQSNEQENASTDNPSGNGSGTAEISQNSNNTDSNVKITLSALTVTKVTPSTNHITFTWSGDASATGYEIEYSVNADLSNSQKAYWNKHSLKYYRLTDLNENTTYYYRLRAYKGNGDEREYSEWTSVASVQTKAKESETEDETNQKVSAPKIKLKSVKNKKKKTIVVKWKWNVKADGYQISYAKKKSFSGAKNKNANEYKNSVTIKNLTKGNTYYVRVRSFIKNDTGNKIFGKWSNVKKVKIKK